MKEYLEDDLEWDNLTFVYRSLDPESDRLRYMLTGWVKTP